MKKTLLTIALIAGVIAAVSCQKESIKENLTSAPQFTATIENGAGTKTTVERVSDGEEKPTYYYKTRWENTDQISINGAVYTATPKTDATKADFNYSSGTTPAAPYSAYYPATMYDASKATLPASYTYSEGKYNMPMYAYNATSTNLSFKNLCGVLAITVPHEQMAEVSCITVISDKQMNGTFTATPEGVLTFSPKKTGADYKKVTLNFSEAVSIETGWSVTFYIPVPAETHNPLTINVYNGSIMKTMVTKKSGGVKVARNTVYPITFIEDQTVLLPGVFSVSAGSKPEVVRFTKGNLYNESDMNESFMMEENQYDSHSLWNVKHVSHFYWAKTASTAYAETYTDETRVKSDSFFCDENNTLTVNDQAGLYALSKNQWKYLINDRTGKMAGTVGTQTDARFAKVKVGEIPGLLIFPDGFTWPSEIENVPENVNIGTTGWDKVPTYQIAEFTILESAGCVFLPAAGHRSGNEINNHGSEGIYWSATPLNDVTKASSLHFYDSKVEHSSNLNTRDKGCSIRLVSNVE